ncbi:MAG: hypothetical protein R2940_04540 [Syntrophotaleaceae bacterium]
MKVAPPPKVIIPTIIPMIPEAFMWVSVPGVAIMEIGPDDNPLVHSQRVTMTKASAIHIADTVMMVSVCILESIVYGLLFAGDEIRRFLSETASRQSHYRRGDSRQNAGCSHDCSPS